jgi:regulation of enolase protein 1 (concanavalin A-like superfamily)
MNFRILKFTALSYALTSAFTIANAWNGPQGVTFSTSQEFQTTIADGFQVSQPWNAVWHQNNNTYFVWVDKNFRPWVTQIANGKTVTTVPVDTGTDYAAQPDGHHRFSIGVDTDGYIHVTGDMHNYYDGTTGVINPYPLRYQKQKILYWKSNNPNNVNGGFSFAGGLNSSTAIPGGGWMMGRFFADNNGVLYYSSSVHAYESGTNVGLEAVGLYTYSTTTKTWKSIGGLANNGGQPSTSHLFPVFYWELAGLAPNGWFQNYEASFKFDTANRLHFTVVAISKSTENGANRVMYAFSDDGGNSWKKANGNIIPSLPIRGIDTEASVGDVVLDIGTTTNYLSAPVGLIVDKYGQQGVSISDTNHAFNIWHSWNGKAWNTTSNTQNNSTLPTATFAYRTNDNNLVYNVPVTAKLLYGDSLHDPVYGYDVLGYSSFDNIDEYAALHYGQIYGIGVNGTVETVLVTQPVLAPLPAGWACGDIGKPASLYLGTCGYVNNNFVSTNYQPGVNWGGTTDNYHFTYKKIFGNTTIIAQVNSLPNGSDVGLMIRSNLTPTAINAAILIDGNNVGMNYRTARASRALSNKKQFNVKSNAPINWLKLVRTGNTVTGYFSSDGKAWSQYQAITIPLNKSIYVGLTASSGQAGWYIENATFSNVTIN